MEVKLFSKSDENANQSSRLDARKLMGAEGADNQQAMLDVQARRRRLTFKLTVARGNKVFVKFLFKV